jgi:hypothetical protein
MALTGEMGPSLVVCERVVLMADGRLRSAALGRSSISLMLVLDRADFCASWSMTAAYRRSMSACARCWWSSMTFWSKDVGEPMMGLVTVESLFLNFRNHDVAERADRGGEARPAVLIDGGIGLLWISSSKGLGGSRAFRLILLPMVRSRTPQISTVRT